ncbi:capsular biosynthesis protein [Pseudodesulfovibrio cashew]|uniref:Capsular biosynthesis protein n=1 Tax=Pseudodesulfovibrio cashew TaxID=2678688 RepID=A0A6I6JPL6_9BACT|nr:glycosyltransferase family 2 protein [Pseudodesulfovibrio cashew]QGY39574.1 capsular biosynthesis protein [Pseudodesulfovibrio cashew]
MIVIPMAGLSSRFAKAGYVLPKYMLEAHGKSLFRHAVESFSRYFGDTPFLFVLRDVVGTRAFVEEECRDMGVADTRVVALEDLTRGQAETVLMGIDLAGVDDDVPLTIFNIDSVRPGFVHPEWADRCDGYLEVFRGEGAHWSFVDPSQRNDGRVRRTTEKVRISDLCSNGLYHFARAGDFREAVAVQAALSGDRFQGGELYVAPLYNELIARKRDIRYRVVDRDAVQFSGTPEEYEAFCRRPLSKGADA